MTNPRIPGLQQGDYTWLATLAVMKPSLFHQFMLENKWSHGSGPLESYIKDGRINS